jgi:hypothetical protein
VRATNPGGEADPMVLSAFDDERNEPQDEALRATLGRSYSLWLELQERMQARFGPLAIAWGFASRSTGWGLRLRQRKRTVLYMTPRTRHFLASFALGEKAVAAAQTAGLSAALLAAIDAAPRYAEGRGLRIEVRKRADVEDVERIAVVKMQN